VQQAQVPEVELLQVLASVLQFQELVPLQAGLFPLPELQVAQFLELVLAREGQFPLLEAVVEFALQELFQFLLRVLPDFSSVPGHPRYFALKSAKKQRKSATQQQKACDINSKMILLQSANDQAD